MSLAFHIIKIMISFLTKERTETMNDNDFPNIKPANFTERDCILHSLIEATLEKKNDKNFILNMINYLAKYREVNGEDVIIDILFIKYLKKIRINFEPEKLISPYHIAVACFGNDYKTVNTLKTEADKIINGEKIVISGIELPNHISYKILKYKACAITTDYIIRNDESEMVKKLTPHNEILESIKNRKIVNFDVLWQPISEDVIKSIYNEFMKDAYQYMPLDFWALVAEYEYITDFLIIPEDNPYLLNAGACLSYECRRIVVNYDITKIQLPKEINAVVNKLMCYKLSLRKLLEYPTKSIEIKNLCSLVYLLYLNEIPMKSLLNFANLIDFRSFFILIFTLSNYINFTIPEAIIRSMSHYLNSNKINDFLFIKYFFSLIISTTNISSLIPIKYLYIAPENIIAKTNFSKIEDDVTFYGIAKKCLMNGKIISREKIKNNEDMKRFLNKMISYADTKTKKMIFFEFLSDLSDPQNFIKALSYYIDDGEYSNAINLLIDAKPTENILKSLKSQSMITKIKKLLCKINQFDCSFEILAKFDLQSFLTNDEKYELFFKDTLHEINFNVSRESVFHDSNKIFKKYDMNNKKIKVKYENELGVDAGGLTRDWFTAISEAIKDEKIFIPTPNGDTLSFNINNKNKDYFFFIGQLIGVALSNKENLTLKLSSFIWKKMLNHQISLEDMKDYDKEIYNSLKWILNNDVTDCLLTFVNSDDVELIEGGKDIEVNNNNKINYINLILEDKFLKNFKTEIENISSGFRAVIGKRKIDLLYSAKEIEQIINGKDIIDINDWKRNTDYSKIYEKQYNMFFTVISKWSMIKQKKLLKFVTGSSQVPIDGFKDYSKRGGLFKLNFIEYQKHRLPSSHTCSNHIDIPCYLTCEEFDQSLSYAIECNDFGFK